MNCPNRAYMPYIVSYMAYALNREFEKDNIFSIDELLQATPESIVRWMSIKAFGTAEPGPMDTPSKCRSTTLEMCKKAVSWLMPHRTAPWNTITKFGNPTRSKEVQELLKQVKKKRLDGKAEFLASNGQLQSKGFVWRLVCLKPKQTSTASTASLP